MLYAYIDGCQPSSVPAVFTQGIKNMYNLLFLSRRQFTSKLLNALSFSTSRSSSS